MVPRPRAGVATRGEVVIHRVYDGVAELSSEQMAQNLVEHGSSAWRHQDWELTRWKPGGSGRAAVRGGGLLGVLATGVGAVSSEGGAPTVAVPLYVAAGKPLEVRVEGYSTGGRIQWLGMKGRGEVAIGADGTAVVPAAGIKREIDSLIHVRVAGAGGTQVVLVCSPSLLGPAKDLARLDQRLAEDGNEAGRARLRECVLPDLALLAREPYGFSAQDRAHAAAQIMRIADSGGCAALREYAEAVSEARPAEVDGGGSASPGGAGGDGAGGADAGGKKGGDGAGDDAEASVKPEKDEAAWGASTKRRRKGDCCTESGRWNILAGFPCASTEAAYLTYMDRSKLREIPYNFVPLVYAMQLVDAWLREQRITPFLQAGLPLALRVSLAARLLVLSVWTTDRFRLVFPFTHLHGLGPNLLCLMVHLVTPYWYMWLSWRCNLAMILAIAVVNIVSHVTMRWTLPVLMAHGVLWVVQWHLFPIYSSSFMKELPSGTDFFDFPDMQSFQEATANVVAMHVSMMLATVAICLGSEFGLRRNFHRHLLAKAKQQS